ncbi:hypothetical protein VP01_773g5 [Puccinia sorghi]|uniref:Uncharacterized protein n=1 Tax=Puccinia sorghi TaxID=27349 RepID=A0A0L6UBE0_9BASI|nr:hypothetical protein VP01_773g5 [Puccinia sorghi]
MWNQRVLGTHRRKTLSYLLRPFFFPHCLGSNGNGAAALRLKNLFQVGYRKINIKWLPCCVFQT